MPDDLEALGCYATAYDIRAGREPLAQGIAHVRDYCLARILKAIPEREAQDRMSPPIPGTWGATALSGLIERRDELQSFIERWEVEHVIA